MADQNSQYMAMLTAVGEAKLANATALGVNLNITQLGVGDANGAEPMPSRTQTALINERRRAPLNQLSIDPNNSAIIIAEQVIPEDIGGWWIREIGLYDEAGDLVAVANCPPTFKPELAQGSGRTQVVRLNILVSSTQNIQLKIDPSVVLATRKYVDDLTVRATQADAETGTDNSKIMTALRVWQAITKRFSSQAQAEAGTDNATAMTPLRVWQAITKRFSTQAQAEAGTDDATVMTPLKVFQAIAAKILFAGTTEAQAGVDNTKVMTPLRVLQAITARIATQAQVDAGTDDSTIVTPKKLRFGFQAVLAANGYIIFPTWLGGVILQWGAIGVSGSSTAVSYHVAYPNGCVGAAITRCSSGSASVEYAQVSTYTLTNFTVTAYVSIDTNNTPGGATISWLSLGW